MCCGWIFGASPIHLHRNSPGPVLCALLNRTMVLPRARRPNASPSLKSSSRPAPFLRKEISADNLDRLLWFFPSALDRRDPGGPFQRTAGQPCAVQEGGACHPPVHATDVAGASLFVQAIVCRNL
jgi:hypothetical protein